MFIRTKNISGKNYAYLVENMWKKGSKQRVKEYLGKVIELRLIEEGKVNIDAENFKESVMKLIKHNLISHGFIGMNEIYQQENILINLDTSKITYKNKPAVLKMNEGFLCNFTLEELSKIDPKQMTPMQLASALVEAGLKINEEEFVKLHEKIPKEIDDPHTIEIVNY